MTGSTFDDRLLWLLFGCAIGFVLGYIVRSLREMNDKLDEVEDLLGEDLEKRKGQSGFMRYPLIADIALFLVIGITVYAAFQSQEASNNVRHLAQCIKQYNLKQGSSIGSRDHIAKAITTSEQHLWHKYLTLYREVKKDSSKIPSAQRELNRSIRHYTRDLARLQDARSDNPYPDPDVLKACAGDSK